MPEPDAVKVARPVLRREGAGNRSFLFDVALPNIWVEASKEVTIVQWIEDLEKSERQLLMSCIEVQNLP
jgi:hypothetical protein